MTEKTVRLFFALWPDEAVRQQLLGSAKPLQLKRNGRLMRAANLHMTLHFIGNTSHDNAECLQQKAREVVAEPFNLQLNTIGQFRRAAIVWLGCSSPPKALHHLHEQLGVSISQCDFQPEERVYRPHVTLYRKAALKDEARVITPVEWHVDSFSLVRSENDRDGVVYSEMEQYPLKRMPGL